MGDLPTIIKNKLPDAARVDAVYLDDAVYLVADAIADMAAVEKILSSRLLRHVALASLAGAEWPLIVNEIQQLKARDEPQIVRLANQVRQRYGELAPQAEAKEILTVAVQSRLEEGALAGILRRLREAIAGTLRKMGFRHRFDTVDLDVAITSAEKEIESEQDIVHGRGLPGFAVVTGFPEDDAAVSPVGTAQIHPRSPLAREKSTMGLQL